MRAQDIMKLANSNCFDIYKLNNLNQDLFSLKHMVGQDFPSWEVVSQNISFSDALEAYHHLKSEDKYPLLLWKDFTTFDIIQIIKIGFRIFRTAENSDSNIDEFDEFKLNWKCHRKCESIHEKVMYLNHLLLDPRNILID